MQPTTHSTTILQVELHVKGMGQMMRHGHDLHGNHTFIDSEDSDIKIIYTDIHPQEKTVPKISKEEQQKLYKQLMGYKLKNQKRNQAWTGTCIAVTVLTQIYTMRNFSLRLHL